MPERGDERIAGLAVPVFLDFERLERESRQDLPKKMAAAGEKAAGELVKALEARYRRDIGDAKEALARGLIDEREFKRQAERAGRAFDEQILRRIEQLAESGGGAQREMSDLANRLKLVGDEADEAGEKGAVGFGRMKAAVAAVVAFLAGSRFVSYLRDSARAGIDLTRSFLRLEASAKLFGVEQSELNRLSQEGVDRYKLSITTANELAASVAKLTNRAQEGARSQELYAAALDLGAAQGLSATEVSQALEQTLRGLDEGTDKLLQRNPQSIFREYAASLGRTAGSLTDVEQKQALLQALLREGAKVVGEYDRFLQTDVGTLQQWDVALQRARERIGIALIPTLAKLAETLSGPLEAGVDVFTRFLDRLDRWTSTPLENLVDGLRRAGVEAERLVVPTLLQSREELQRERDRIRRSSDRFRVARPALEAGFGTLAPAAFADQRAPWQNESRVALRDFTLVELPELRSELERVEEALRADDLTGELAQGLADYASSLQDVIQKRERELEVFEELAQVEKDLQVARGRPPAGREGDGAGGGAGGPGPGGGGDGGAERIARAKARLEALEQDLRDRVARLTTTATDELEGALDRLQEKAETAAAEAGVALSEEFKSQMERLRQEVDDLRIFEEFADRFEQIQAGGGFAQVVSLEVLIRDLERAVEETEDGSTAQERLNDLLEDALELRERGADAAERTTDDTDEERAAREAAAAETERIRRLRETARTIEENARAALQLAQAFGVVDDEVARVLESVAQLGTSIFRIAEGDLSAIPSALGGLASLGSALLGRGSEEERAEAERLQRISENTTALLEVARSLDDFVGRLRELRPDEVADFRRFVAGEFGSEGRSAVRRGTTVGARAARFFGIDPTTAGDPAIRQLLQDLLADLLERTREQVQSEIVPEFAARGAAARGDTREAQRIRLFAEAAQEKQDLQDLEAAGFISPEQLQEYIAIIDQELVNALEKAAEAARRAAYEFQNDLTIRRARLEGRDADAIQAQLEAQAKAELDAAHDLLDAGTITQEMFDELADILNDELAAALEKVAEEARRARDEFVTGTAIRRARLEGQDQEALRRQLEFDAAQELAAAQDLLEAGTITKAMFEEFAALLNDEVAAALQNAAEAAKEAAEAAKFQDEQEHGRLRVQLLRARGQDEAARRLENQLELEAAIQRGKSDAFIRDLRALQAARAQEIQAVEATTRAIEGRTRALNSPRGFPLQYYVNRAAAGYPAPSVDNSQVTHSSNTVNVGGITIEAAPGESGYEIWKKLKPYLENEISAGGRPFTFYSGSGIL